MLTIAVEAIDFDTQACVLRVKGRNIQENQYVKVSGSNVQGAKLQNIIGFSFRKATSKHWESSTFPGFPNG